MVQRLTYRRRTSFRTVGNQVRKVKTPGARLVFQMRAKKTQVAKCGDCGVDLHGMVCARPKALRTLKQRQRTVSRPYGGSRCGHCVRQRIVRAFLIEEQKIVKSVLRARAAGAAGGAAKKS